MTLKSFLTDFSLPEIFQFLEKGKKTGLLSFSAVSASQVTPQPVHYIWVRQGYVVAAADRLDHQGLVSLIEQQQWIGDLLHHKFPKLHPAPLPRAFDKLIHWYCPVNQPLGKCLKEHGALHVSQLEQLFNLQVSQQVCAILQLKDAQFQFNQNLQIPTREMTGLSVPVTEAMLIGLRVLPSWEALADRLPGPNEHIASIMIGQPHYRLDDLELQVWKYASRTASLQELAHLLKLPIEKVQQVAFRLSTVGLVAVRKKIH